MKIVYVDDERLHLDIVENATVKLADVHRRNIDLVFLSNVREDVVEHVEHRLSERVIHRAYVDGEALVLHQAQHGHGPSETHLLELADRDDTIFILDQRWIDDVDFGAGLAKWLNGKGVPRNRILMFSQISPSDEARPYAIYVYDKRQFLGENGVDFMVDVLRVPVNACMENELISKTAPDPRKYNLMGASPAFLGVWARLARIGKNSPGGAPTHVLVTGAQGTKRALYARALARLGGRKDPVELPKQALDDARADEQVAEFLNEAFGRDLIIEDVEGLSPKVQVVLRRALENGHFKRAGKRQDLGVRVIALSRGDRAQLIDQAFDHKLASLLAGETVALPSLKEREGDVILIAQHLCRRSPNDAITLSEGVWDAFCSYDWPYNEAELENVIAAALGQLPPSASELLPVHLSKQVIKPGATPWYDWRVSAMARRSNGASLSPQDRLTRMFGNLRLLTNHSGAITRVQLRHAFQQLLAGSDAAERFFALFLQDFSAEVFEQSLSREERAFLEFVIGLIASAGPEGVAFLDRQGFTQEAVARASERLDGPRDDRSLDAFGRKVGDNDQFVTTFKRLLEKAE